MIHLFCIIFLEENGDEDDMVKEPLSLYTRSVCVN